MWTFFSLFARKPTVRRARGCRLLPRVEALEGRCCPSGGKMQWSDPVPTSVKSADAVLIQPWDGKILLAGYGNANGGTVMDLARYNTDGTLDTSFGSSGIVISKFSTNAWSAAAVYSSTDTTGNAKKIVEAGSGSLARFNADGSVDTSFGKRGLVSVSSTSGIIGVVIQPADGKIVIAGNTSGGDFVLTRYNSHGTLDTTFGVGGTATLSAPGALGGPALEALGLQADGKFVVVGEGAWPSTVLELARITPSGTLDTTFGGGKGYVTTSFGSDDVVHMRLAIYPSTGPDSADYGKIEAAGFISGNPGGINGNQIALARFNPDGSPDSSFGQSGQVVTPFPTGGAMAWATALQVDGKIIVAGQTVTASAGGWWFSLLRYNRDGSLDATFGSGGLVQTTIGSAPSKAQGVAVEPDGRIVAVGTMNNLSQFMVACYLPSEPEIGSFTATPNLVTAGSNVALNAWNISDANPSAAITQVTFYYFDNGGNKVTLGTGTQTSPGVWTLNYAVNLASGPYTIYAQAEDSYAVFGDPLAITLSVQ